MTYAILHAHDTYGSIGDSTLYIRDYIKRAKELGIQNLALTNHGSLSTFVEFYNACHAADINPIIGCEFYYTDDIGGLLLYSRYAADDNRAAGRNDDEDLFQHSGHPALPCKGEGDDQGRTGLC